MKRILITGSSRGIGKAIAKLAKERGYEVILHGKTNSENLQRTSKELGISITTYFDVSNRKEVKEGINNLVKQHGNIDILVNNAGVRLNPMKDIDDLDEKSAIGEWKTNVLGTIYCTQAVLPGMIENKSGSVVNIASIKGQYSLATMSSLTFSATKSGIISITKSLAKAYADKGIRFNSVSPGYVETDQVDDWNPSTLKRIEEGTLFSRMAKPEEIAPIVIFLASDDSSYMTGEDLLIDGGYLLRGK